MKFLAISLVIAAVFAKVQSACENKSNYCLGWKAVGYCKSTSQHFVWMKENCARSCNLCPTAPPPTSSGCVDREETHCKTLKTLCNNPNYQDYLKANCARTCNFCSSITPTPTVIPKEDVGKCGLRGDGHTRIVGGSNARPGDWPWQVQIDLKGDWNRYWCGGTLLNDEWILSAAHCFEDDLDADSYTIYLGEHDIRKKSPNEQKIEIAEIIMHPKFESSRVNNDMALIRLKKKASFNYFVRPACFPDPSTTSFPDGEECYVTGWGALETDGSSPRILQQAKIPLVSKRECHRAMGTLTSSMMCAGYSYKKVDSCQGDSGGPLVCKKRDTTSGKDIWYLWGVVSWGLDCASPGYYGVYASVENMGRWVSDIVFK